MYLACHIACSGCHQGVGGNWGHCPLRDHKVLLQCRLLPRDPLDHHLLGHYLGQHLLPHPLVFFAFTLPEQVSWLLSPCCHFWAIDPGPVDRVDKVDRGPFDPHTWLGSAGVPGRGRQRTGYGPLRSTTSHSSWVQETYLNTSQAPLTHWRKVSAARSAFSPLAHKILKMLLKTADNTVETGQLEILQLETRFKWLFPKFHVYTHVTHHESLHFRTTCKIVTTEHSSKCRTMIL